MWRFVTILLIFFVSSIVCRSPKQLFETRQNIPVTCSACVGRFERETPRVCCKCIDERASCNNDIAETFGDNDDGVIGIDTKQGNINVRQCPRGQKSCCDPIGNDIFSSSEFPGADDDEACSQPDVVAVQDFAHGVTCGKRDSRVYYDAGLPRSFTNPGEWPWAVLIYDDDTYIGAGALVSGDVVVTAGHKVREYQGVGYKLKVRLGDWNPNGRDDKEDFDSIEMNVKCVTLHPEADLDDTLANNVAVLKLDGVLTQDRDDPRKKSVVRVVGLRDGLVRGDQPEKQNLNGGNSIIDVRLGLVADLSGQDPLGDGVDSLNNEAFPTSYINSICLAGSSELSEYESRCWVASWGTDQQRQREVDLPILSRSECIRRLRPEFESRNVPNWSPQPSEVCAGGGDGDTCRGEGGAPLVCYHPGYDQFYLLGLVGYGFKCNNGLPGVYTNMADPGVQDFVKSAIDNDFFCS